MNLLRLKSRKRLLISLSILLLLIVIIPTPRFEAPTSTVIFARQGELLGARIANDGQWRFPLCDSLPDNYIEALTCFEDRWFFYHPGINPVSVFNAIKMNIRNGKVVSGGSTLTMQVARLSRHNPPRNMVGKLLEMAMSVKLELLRSKKTILRMYASSAPFGGNVVGIDAASWRYFQRPPKDLSWGEAALLAVLPNSPSLIYPGKNSSILLKKRDKLLDKLLALGKIDAVSCELAKAEPLPFQPAPLPQLAQHLLAKANQQFSGERVSTSIDFYLQQQVYEIAEQYHSQLKQNGIYNLAILVTNVETGKIEAYVGNVSDPKNQHGGKVDIITSSRSTGSILKPILYAAMLNSGDILPNTLVSDIPINISGYTPKNFDYTNSGAVPAAMALSQSLNIPAVEMLKEFGEARFLDVLRNVGFSTFRNSSEHYGLSLILGGGEANLLELAGCYSSFARVLKNFNQYGNYSSFDWQIPTFLKNEVEKPTTRLSKSGPLTAASIWFTFNALLEVNRPENQSGWRFFDSSSQIAWKTGTSFGFRDAWAVGTTPQYVVAVWAGNADGEGRPGLTGVTAAAPILFDVFDRLPRSNKWFTEPTTETTVVDVCKESGCRASDLCPHIVRSKVPLTGLKTNVCNYHRLVHLTSDRRFQVTAQCYPISKMIADSMFVLPPAQEWFYRKIHPEYRVMPPFLEGCSANSTISQIELIYPRNLNSIYVPLEMNGKRGKVVFEAAHRNLNAHLFWHLDNTFLGETHSIHQMALAPEPGIHTLTIVDQQGNSITKRVTIIRGRED